jgi:hypothetical protein
VDLSVWGVNLKNNKKKDSKRQEAIETFFGYLLIHWRGGRREALVLEKLSDKKTNNRMQQHSIVCFFTSI